MTLRLFDTWSREVRDFAPLDGDAVRMYACGPTVYDYAHIGNLRTYLFEDLLRRTLQRQGYEVRHVVNITDVGHLTSDADSGEDKMEQGAARTGRTVWDIARHHTDAFKVDLRRLNILEPSLWCRATDHIPEQIDFIADLERKGYTYRTGDGIYFDSTRLDNYGYLARLDVEGLRAGARVDQADKRSPTDFALWKFSPAGGQRQMEWESPWGTGFPGWHIECSAMASRYLGDYFDIHCGGEDHIPIHHTNEIAQTTASRGTRLANFWMHGYFLQMNDSKMSKSSGGFLRLDSLIEAGFEPLVYRYFCLTAHYRTQLSFSWDSLKKARTSLERMATHAHQWGAPADEPDAGFVARFNEKIDNDLNMPQALAVAWELVRSELPAPVKKATLLDFDELFGLRLDAWQPQAIEAPDSITRLAQARQQARARRAWAEADRLRDEILAGGYLVEDTRDGFRLKSACE